MTTKKAAAKKKKEVEKQPTGIEMGFIMNPFMGYTARDKVTGFTGVITSYFNCLTGCDQYQLQPKTKAGAHIPSRWFDCNKLELTKAKRIVLDTVHSGPGCDTSPPLGLNG